MRRPPPHQPLAADLGVLLYIGLGTDTVCTGSTDILASNLLMGPASIFASCVRLAYFQEARLITVREPTKCVSGGERREGLSDTPLGCWAFRRVPSFRFLMVGLFLCVEYLVPDTGRVYS